MKSTFSPAAALSAALRQDFPTFIGKCVQTLSGAYLPNWHILAIAWHLEEVRKGNIKRLIISMPPRSLKSICASVAFPAFCLGHDPSERIVCVSYSRALAAKHALDFRALLHSQWFSRVFPRTRIDPAKNTETEITTTSGGFRLSTSTSGTLTGRGGNLIVIDDPLKPDDAMSDALRTSVNDWYSRTLLSRLDDKRSGAIVIVMQRLHLEDLVGHVTEMTDGWTILSLPAIAEIDHRIQVGPGSYHTRQVGDLLHAEREPKVVLDEYKAALGSDIFAAQYQQAPVPPGGFMIKKAWMQRYDAAPVRGRGDQVVQSWDTATQVGERNDWSVGTTWLAQVGRYYLLDVRRVRLEYPDLKREVQEYAAVHRPDSILMEDTALGSALIQELRHVSCPVIAIRPDKDKVTRMAVQAAKFEGGQVFLPSRASWLMDLETELFSFPQSRHDDQIDSISQCLGWITNRPLRPLIYRL